MHFCSMVAKSERSLPKVLFHPEKPICSVNSIPIPMDKIPAFYAGMLEEFREGLAKLTAGHSTDLSLPLTDFWDNMERDAPDYGFLDSWTGDLQPVRMRNIKSLIMAGYLQVVNGEQVWDRVKMKEWLDQAHKLNTLLLVLLHLSCQPARGQELFTMTFRNQQNSHRNLFVSHGNLCWILGYSKVSFCSNFRIFQSNLTLS